MILFSFIIPVYNVEKYLRECLNSIINQTYKNWEVILIDDGSQDNSDKICDEYAIKDKRIKVRHRENEGSLMARRYGVLYAKGDYFLFIDSDDLVNSKLLEVMNKIIESTGSDMVIYRFERFGRLIKSESPKVFEKGTIVGEGGLSKECIWKKVISGDELNNLWLKAVSKDIIDNDVDYQPYAFMKSGTDLMQSMALLDNAKKIYFTDEVLYYYRYNDSGISYYLKKLSLLLNTDSEVCFYIDCIKNQNIAVQIATQIISSVDKNKLSKYTKDTGLVFKKVIESLTTSIDVIPFLNIGELFAGLTVAINDTLDADIEHLSA